jgi:TolB protein
MTAPAGIRLAVAISVATVTALASASNAQAAVSAGVRPDGAFPAANGGIAFTIDRGSGSEIDVVAPSGKHLRQLFGPDPRPVMDADWSPDGHHVVYVMERPRGCSVMIANADGTGIRNLTRARRGCEANPTFTPDGSRIVFAAQHCRKCRTWFWSMNLDGGVRLRIHLAPAGIGLENDSVSPDGKQLAFVGARDQYQRALYMVNMTGGKMRMILPFSLDVGANFNWAPDGRHLAITTYSESPPGHQPNVVKVRPDGTNPVALTHITRPGVGCGGATYAPNGRWIVYRFEDDNTQRYHLMKMHPDGSAKTLIKRMPATVQGIAWSPRPQ